MKIEHLAGPIYLYTFDYIFLKIYLRVIDIRIMVTIRLVGYLKQMAGFRQRDFQITKPTTVRDLVSFKNYPDERIIVLINEIGATLDSELKESDFVKILPVASGG
jgi:sulfur carrier protein ThiS